MVADYNVNKEYQNWTIVGSPKIESFEARLEKRGHKKVVLS